MTEKTNLFPSLIRFRETNRLKMAIATSIMLWCTVPQQATADTYEKQEITAVQQQKVKATGTVVDQSGEPLIGVSVKVKDASSGTVTDLNGKFSFDAPKGATLEISYIGYKTITVRVEGTPINVTMQEDTETLDEVVIVGYGSQKKVNVTGAVSTVDSKALASRPVQNVAQALQGQVPGLTMSVGNSGGALDSSLGINIRGGGTIGSGSKGNPLVLIDGIEGDMNTVNPNDIQNVSVLKDAASSSIYGARAAFGVILITTKSGKSGKTRVSYSGNLRLSEAIQKPSMTNSVDFSTYFNTASANANLAPIFTPAVVENIHKYINGEFTDPTKPEYYGTTAKDNGYWSTYGAGFANTNWFKEFYADWVPAQEHNLSISGGNEKLTYLVSGSFLGQNGLLRHGKDRFYRYTLNSKISAKLADWVTMNYSNKWTREDYDRPTYMTGLFFHNIARRWPTCPVKDPNGHWAADMEVAQMENGGKQTSDKNWLTNQLQFVFEPIKDWHITVEGSLRQYNERYHWAVLPIYGYKVDNTPYLMSWNGGAPGYSEAQDYRKSEDYFSTNIFSDYSKTIGDHYFKVMAGFNAELYKPSDLTGFGTDLITSSVPQLNTAQANPKAYNGISELAIAGFFGRVNYNYKERYMLEANLRYDGSSRFIGDKRWGLFPSFSAGWNVAREAFFEPWSNVVNALKFRGSWGQLGNNETDAWYPFYQNMPTGSANSSWLLNGIRQNTAGMPGIVSNLLTWETVESWNIGLDWGLFSNRLTGSFDYFQRYTYDMTGPAPTLPSVLGTGAPKINNADLESYGWELEISWRDRINDFNYGARFTLSDNQRKILRYPNESGDLGTYYAGQILGDIWGYTTVGIAQSQEEMDAHIAHNKPNWGSNWGAGDIMFKNLVDREGETPGTVNKGSNTLSDHGDLTIIGNNNARYNFGLTLDGSWKGLDFSIFLQGVMKRDFWLGGPYFWGASGDEWQSCCFTEHLDYWTPDNKGAYYPKPYFNYITKNQEVQTRYLQSAAYCRLKNVQIGYTLPKAWTKKAAMESVRFYVSGDNVLTLTSLSSIFDPETLGGEYGFGKLYPLQRTISFGVNVNF